MTTIQATSLPSPQEILKAQEEGGVEFVNGQIAEKPVSITSSMVAGEIFHLLKVEANQSRHAVVFESSMGYQRFADEARKFRKPDVSVVRIERLAKLDAEAGLIPIAPDLAIEVNSHTDRISDVIEKVDEYLGANFPLVWVVDPPTRSVTVYRVDGSIARLRENDEISGEAALPAFKCKIADFFATLL